MENRTDKYKEGKFLHEVDPKDGYPVREYRDARERRLLEFLVPIVHPDKPTRVTCTLRNTIFGAISGERSVDWSVIFMELVNRLVGGACKTKRTPICPFLYHLYESKGLLTEAEETDYRAAEELTQYRITPDQDPDSDSEVLQITGPEPPCVVAFVNQVKQGNMRKQTYRAPEGSPPVRSRGEGSRPTSESNQSEGVRPGSPCLRSPPAENPQLEPKQPEQPEEEKPWVKKPFKVVVESYKLVKAQYQCLERMMEGINLYLDVKPHDMLDHIKELPKPQDLLNLQARVDYLLKENGELRAKVEEGNVLRKEVGELKNRIAVVEKEVKTARTEQDKAKTVA